MPINVLRDPTGLRIREGAQVVEITGLDLGLAGRDPGHREARRSLSGAPLTVTDVEGHRFQVFICDSTDPDTSYLEAPPVKSPVPTIIRRG